ncbi:MAG: hypothetical protein NC548_10995 [Lachnospiraceae bacterium]|nr:hypothetical protein [Lachnospiraceae bacterium]
MEQETNESVVNEADQNAAENKEEKPDLNWKDSFLIYVAIGLVIIFGIFVLKALSNGNVKPSEILEEPEEHSIFEEGGWL